MDKSLSMSFPGTLLARRNGYQEKYRVTKRVIDPHSPRASRVYVRREGLQSEEVWNNSCVMLEDLQRLFELESDGLEDLDI